MSSKKTIAIFSLIFLIPLFVLPWRGFYMLNDDYVYIWNAQNYFSNGFTMHPLTSPTLLLQTFLGSIILNFTNDISYLRLLSYIFYFGSVIFIYLYSKVLGLREKQSLLVCILYAFNPIVLYLGFSFMSESFFMFFYISSAYYFLRYTKEKSIHLLVISVFLVSLSIFQRQTGVILLFIYFLLSLVHKFSNRSRLLFIIPLICLLMIEFLFPKTLAYTDQSVLLTINKLSNPLFLFEVFGRLIKSIYYVGYFVWPIVVVIFLNEVINRKFKQTFNIWFILCFCLFSIFAAGFWIYHKQLMFYIPNILSYAGINPQNLGFGIKQTIFVDSPVRIKALITLLSIFSISYFISLLISFRKIFRRNLLILIVPAIFMFGVSLVFRDFFDRYLVVIVPSISILSGLILVRFSKISNWIMYVTFTIYILISMVFIQDYLSLNKKVWEKSLTVSLNPKDVNSTFEFNNYWYLTETMSITDVDYLFNKRYLPKLEDYKYVVGYTQEPPYCSVEKFSYTSFLSPKFNGQLYILVPCLN